MEPKDIIILTPDCLRAAEDDLLSGIRRQTDLSVKGCYAGGTWTVSSHATLLSARAGYSHDTVRRGEKFEKASVLEAAREQGYTTTLISENPMFGTTHGFGTEMDIIDEHIHLKRFPTQYSPLENVDEGSVRDALAAFHGAILNDRPLRNIANVLFTIYEKSRNSSITEFPHHGDRILGHLSSWLSNYENLFVVANILDPHNPYYCPPKDSNIVITQAEMEAIRTSGGERGYIFGEELCDEAQSEFGSWDRLLERMYDVYRAQIDYTDRLLSEWFDKHSERLSSALTVVVGDHGHLFGMEGIAGHQTSLHPHGIAVPAFVSFPDEWLEAPSIDSSVSMIGLAEAIKATAQGQVTNTSEFIDVWKSSPIITCVDGPIWQIDSLREQYGDDHPALDDLEVRKIGIIKGDLQTVHTCPWEGSEIKTTTYRISPEDRNIVTANPIEINDTQQEWLQNEDIDQHLGSVSERLAMLGYR